MSLNQAPKTKQDSLPSEQFQLPSITVPEGKDFLTLPDPIPSLLDIERLIEKAKKEQRWITGLQNKIEQERLIEYLHFLKQESKDTKMINEANNINYEEGMSFNNLQNSLVQTFAKSKHIDFHESNDLFLLERLVDELRSSEASGSALFYGINPMDFGFNHKEVSLREVFERVFPKVGTRVTSK